MLYELRRGGVAANLHSGEASRLREAAILTSECIPINTGQKKAALEGGPCLPGGVRFERD
jgi:hypothetical protein